MKDCEHREKRVKEILPCGWCKLHNMALNLNQLRKKKCLAKGCWHLEKYTSHPYWAERDQIKHNKKIKKREERERNENTIGGSI